MKAFLILVLAGVLAIAAGCSKKLTELVTTNQPPTLSLAPVLTEPANDDGYRVRLRWSATDADGRVQHYLYAIDPPSLDRVDESWVTTAETDLALTFPSRGGHVSAREARHVFAVRAVDDQGAMSKVQAVALGEGNQPPTVQITDPQPSALEIQSTPPTVRIYWQGSDPDSGEGQGLVSYKYLLLHDHSEFPMSLAIARPDSLRNYYAPTFAGWDSTGADVTSALLENLTPHREYLFVVVAIDAQGEHSQLFSLDINMLRFRVFPEGAPPARLRVFTTFFEHTFMNDEELVLELVAGEPVTLNWMAPTLLDDTAYRWVLDPVDPDDETPRSDPADLHHWSPWSPDERSMTLVPSSDQGEHRLYIETRHRFGLVTRFLVRIPVQTLTRSADLLIVDDTRFKPDGLDRATGCMRPPLGPWPTAAELDSFLFARGGHPWRCYPEGTICPPGIFSGYRHDTLGTRRRTSIPFATLARYRHVVWIVDRVGSSFVADPTDPHTPITSLRWMSSAGNANTLARYAASGGKVWLVGGGGALASLLPWNKLANDIPTTTFVFDRPHSELVQGRMMYDVAGWRSEARSAAEPTWARRFGGRLEGSELLARLPATLDLKTAATDPLPPLRRATDFYPQVAVFEYLQVPNEIVENGESMLDSLYESVGGGLPRPENAHNVVMTHFHGRSLPRSFVFSGFDLWSWNRAQSIQVVDFVLGRLWGLPRESTAQRVVATASRSAAPSRRP